MPTAGAQAHLGPRSPAQLASLGLGLEEGWAEGLWRAGAGGWTCLPYSWQQQAPLTAAATTGLGLRQSHQARGKEKAFALEAEAAAGGLQVQSQPEPPSKTLSQNEQWAGDAAQCPSSLGSASRATQGRPEGRRGKASSPQGPGDSFGARATSARLQRGDGGSQPRASQTSHQQAMPFKDKVPAHGKSSQERARIKGASAELPQT